MQDLAQPIEQDGPRRIPDRSLVDADLWRAWGRSERSQSLVCSMRVTDRTYGLVCVAMTMCSGCPAPDATTDPKVLPLPKPPPARVPAPAPPPPYDFTAAWDDARAALLAFQLDKAGHYARKAEDLNPKSRAPLELQIAIYEALGLEKLQKRAEAALAQLPAVVVVGKPGSSEPAYPIRPGRNFVSRSQVEVRTRTSTEAPLVGHLALNDVVHVDAIIEDWAYVERRPTDGVVTLTSTQAIRAFGYSPGPKSKMIPAQPTESKGVKVQGLVPLTHLAPDPVTVAQMQREAQECLAADDITCAVERSKVALELSPTDRLRARGLIEMAFTAGHFRAAAFAAQTQFQMHPKRWTNVEVAYACAAGASPTARWVSEAMQPTTGACVTDVDERGPCPPEPPPEPKRLDFLTDEEFDAAVDLYLRTESEAADAKHVAEQEAWDSEMAAHAAKMRTLRARYSEPGVVRITLSGGIEAAASAKRLFVYQHGIRIDDCGVGARSRRRAVLYPVAFEFPRNGERLVIFVPVSDYSDTRHGILEAHDLQDAWQMIRDSIGSDDIIVTGAGTYEDIRAADCPEACD